jgi:integrase
VRVWGGTQGGKPQRFSRKTPEAAFAEAQRRQRAIDQHGQLAHALTTGQHYVAAQIFTIAARLGVDALDVMRDFEKTHPHGENARTLEQVRVELIEMKKRGDRRAIYVSGFDYRLRCLVKSFPNSPISSITTGMLEAELKRRPDWSSGTVHGIVTSWKVIFNYAVKRGYCLKNPCALIELPRKRKAKPLLLPAKDVHRLLAGCITRPYMAACLPYVAIGCFTGIRPEEMQRLRWEMFNFAAGFITIDGEDAKCGERGIVKMSANLISWIRPIAKESGSVLTAKVGKLRTLCRGFLNSTRPPGTPELKRWPHDCMRHGFASFHYGFHRDIGEVCAMLRHGTGQLVFINNYYIPRDPAEAVYFWKMIVRPVAFLTA